MGFPLSQPDSQVVDNFDEFLRTKDAKINPPDTK